MLLLRLEDSAVHIFGHDRLDFVADAKFQNSRALRLQIRGGRLLRKGTEAGKQEPDRTDHHKQDQRPPARRRELLRNTPDGRPAKNDTAVGHAGLIVPNGCPEEANSRTGKGGQDLGGFSGAGAGAGFCCKAASSSTAFTFGSSRTFAKAGSVRALRTSL